MTSLGYQIKRGKQTAAFTCVFDTEAGPYSLREGDKLKAVSNGYGMFNLFASWAEGSLGLFTAEQINTLAGFQAVQ
jgi:hypothetical protein